MPSETEVNILHCLQTHQMAFSSKFASERIYGESSTPIPASISRKHSLVMSSGRMVKDQYDELRNFLICSSNSGMQAMRGSFFEVFAHQQLAAGGKFQIRKLSKGSKVTETSVLELPTNPTFRFSLLTTAAATKGDYYFVPKMSNLQSVDSLIKV